MRFCGQTCLPLEIYDFPALPAELFSIRQLYDAFDVSSAVFADDGFPADQLGAVGTAFQMAGRRFRIIQTENDDDGDDARKQTVYEPQKDASVLAGSRCGADNETDEQYSRWAVPACRGQTYVPVRIRGVGRMRNVCEVFFNKSFRKEDGGAGEGGKPFFKRVSSFPRITLPPLLLSYFRRTFPFPASSQSFYNLPITPMIIISYVRAFSLFFPLVR